MGLFPSYAGAAQLKLMDSDVFDTAVRLIGGSGSATNLVNMKLTERKNLISFNLE